MSRSFIPKDTCVVCTNMTVAKPLKLAHEHGSTTFYKGEKKELLNINDRKISDTFVCKNPAKMWGGLGAMLLGIGLGLIVGALLVVAIVGTGGLALPGIIALGAAIAVGGTGCLVAGEIQAHDCDATKSGTWKLVHETVFIDQQKSLLQTSILSCSKGGMISIVPDPVLAQSYANIYAENNKKEIDTHTNSQVLEGLITGITFLGSPIAAVVGLGFGVMFYAKGETESQDNQHKILNSETVKPRTMGDDFDSSLDQETTNQPIGIGIGIGEELNDMKNNRAIQRAQAEHLERQAAQQEARAARLAANGAENESRFVAGRAANSRLAADIARRSSPKFNFGKLFAGIGVGIAGAGLNFFIEYNANSNEDDLFKNTRNSFFELIRNSYNNKKGINIVALQK